MHRKKEKLVENGKYTHVGQIDLPLISLFLPAHIHQDPLPCRPHQTRVGRKGGVDEEVLGIEDGVPWRAGLEARPPERGGLAGCPSKRLEWKVVGFVLWI